MRPLIHLLIRGAFGLLLVGISSPAQAAPRGRPMPRPTGRPAFPRPATSFRVVPRNTFFLAPVPFFRFPAPNFQVRQQLFNQNIIGGGYGGGSGGYGGGSGGYSGPMGGNQSALPMPQFAPYSSPEQSEPANAVDTLGLAMRNGQLDWPLGLRLLPPQMQEVRRQIDSLMQQAAIQAAAGGKVNPAIVQQATRAIDQLHAALLAKRDRMASITFNDAEGFLSRIENALKARE